MKPKTFFVGCLLICTTAGCVTPSDSAVDNSGIYREGMPNSHLYIANRLFHVRSSPKLSGTVVEQINKGESVNATLVFHDEIWNHIKLDDGSEGYIFGMPLTPLRLSEGY